MKVLRNIYNHFYSYLDEHARRAGPYFVFVYSLRKKYFPRITYILNQTTVYKVLMKKIYSNRDSKAQTPANYQPQNQKGSISNKSNQDIKSLNCSKNNDKSTVRNQGLKAQVTDTTPSRQRISIFSQETNSKKRESSQNGSQMSQTPKIQAQNSTPPIYIPSNIPQHESSFHNQTYGHEIVPAGLPNIGNTCHLNSILQFLFGATAFRNYIIDISRKVNSQTDMIKIIGELFKLLQSNQNDNNKKRDLLHLFVSNLEKLNLTYKRYSQEDAFETLNNILNNLNYRPEQKDHITFMFSLDYSLYCKKCMSSEIRLSSIFPAFEEKCENCNNQFVKKYQNTPQYLILTQQMLKQQFPFQRKLYRFVSSIIYSGSGRFGHYVCLRKQNRVYYQLDDNYPKEVKKRELNKYFSLEHDHIKESEYYYRKKTIAALYIKMSEQDIQKQKNNIKIREEKQDKQRQRIQLKREEEKFMNWFNKQMQCYQQGSEDMKWIQENQFWIRQQWPQMMAKKSKSTMDDFKQHYQLLESVKK